MKLTVPAIVAGATVALSGGVALAKAMPRKAVVQHRPHARYVHRARKAHGPVWHTMAGGLKVQDLKVGKGPVAKKGETVTVNYTGWLMNGKKFDSSLNPGRSPFQFTLGAGQVIRGWDEGVAGMRVGGERMLIIPPALGYGATGTPGGPIPPNATLKFKVDLLAIK